MPPQNNESLDLICLSHLRWDFVFQRPQHLLTRCAAERRVFYVEEPFFDAAPDPFLERQQRGDVSIAIPHLPPDCSSEEACDIQRRLLDELIRAEHINDFILWYYTPMAVAFSRHLRPQAVVYDCMDELSAFQNAPPTLTVREGELMRTASVVFTGGQSLYEVKRNAHPNVRAFPSSVDVDHFARARRMAVDPPDQATLARPRLGFFGVIDERFDSDLLAGAAAARPDWQFVMLGPVVKIDAATLPRAANIHYLGAKAYAELPQYIAGWDVALLLFARNESTRFISPTKTPEYMAAGKPVVSTSIRDVIRPYGQRGLVRIADSVPDFVAACEAAMAEDPAARVRDADAFLRQTSWDGTWAQMRQIVLATIHPARTDARAASAV